MMKKQKQRSENGARKTVRILDIDNLEADDE